MKFETAFLKGNKALFIQEMRQNPNQTCQLRYGRRHSRTADSPIQDKNEYRRNNHIDCDCKKRRKHRFLRIACRTHQIIQSDKQIRNRIGYQYNLHKIPGIRQCFVARPEKQQNRVKKNKGYNCNEQPIYKQ